MPKLIATFSNGHTDVYNGDRKVRAAWMITNRETGEVLSSGHSLDRVKAQKTAEGNVQNVVALHDLPSFFLPQSMSRVLNPDFGKYLCKQVRAAGLADDIEPGKLKVSEAFKRAKAANARKNAAKRALVSIEVVDLPVEG